MIQNKQWTTVQLLVLCVCLMISQATETRWCDLFFETQYNKENNFQV